MGNLFTITGQINCGT